MDQGKGSPLSQVTSEQEIETRVPSTYDLEGGWGKGQQLHSLNSKWLLKKVTQETPSRKLWWEP